VRIIKDAPIVDSNAENSVAPQIALDSCCVNAYAQLLIDALNEGERQELRRMKTDCSTPMKRNPQMNNSDPPKYAYESVMWICGEDEWVNS
jgi:hypothetical protein